MKTIRIGNDIVIDWTIIRNGRPEDFRAKSLSLFICHRYGRERVETFSIEGNKIRFAFLGKNQRYIGDYGLLLIVNDGSDGMFSVDLDSAFCLTQHTDCGCDGVIELMSDIALPANGLSAYELAVINGYEGTEQEWLESLVQPAKAAAAEALAAAERADSATETAMATNTAVQRAEQLRVAAEQERVSAESQRTKAEQVRTTAESGRDKAEQARVTAESQRTKAEQQRGTAESERAAAETDRTNAESKRELSETERKQAEETRIASEQTRTTAESSRVKSEDARVAAESARQTAEAKRQQDTAAAIKNAETATTEANNAAGKANVAANRAEEGAINLGIEDYPEFSVEKAYIAGDVVRYSGKLYRFTSAHPAGAWIGTDAEQTSVKEELDRAVAMKANVDGYYETMRVGTADNLTPRGDASEEFIMNRTAGGNNAIEFGDALIKSIKGNSLVRNQKIDIGKFSQKTESGLTFTVESNYVVVDGVATAEHMFNLFPAPIVAGHHYFYRTQNFFVAKISPNKVSVASESYERNTGYFKCSVGESFHQKKYELMMFDLTQMFGAGNEPATPEEFAHRLGYDSIEQIPYLPYNEGEIVSCNAEGIRTTDAEGDTYERKWATTLHEYFPRGLQSVGNVYDEITPNKAIKRISNNREILQQPEEYPYDELNLSMRVSPGGTEEAIIPKGVLSTPLRMDVVYPIDAYGTIVNNRQRIGNLSSLQTQAKADLVSAINELKEVLSTLAVKSESNERNITQLRADTDGIITDWGVDNRTLPLLCGQPMILFGHGAPAKGVVPDNWIQFDPVSGQGYDWNGTPSVLGQQYLDVDVSAGGFYIAARDKDMGLKWINC